MQSYQILFCLLSCIEIARCTPSNLHTRGHPHDHEHDHGERIEDAFEQHVNQANHHATSGDAFDDDRELDHEAVLGSRRQVQEFNELAPDEAKRRLKALVETRMDANHDGFVDQIELSEWVMKSFKNLANEEGEDRLEEDDIDNDKLVSWDEYLKGSFDSAELQTDSKNELLAEDEVLWKAADVDSDGKLDADEYAAFNSPEEFEHMHHVLVKQMLDRRDRNKDGFIDFREYISDERGDTPDAKSEQFISEKDKFENVYDANHDGRLDFNECLMWIVPNNTEIAENEARHLISSADMDQDDKLSVKEIIDNYEVFVGSEATHFGEQLKDMHDEL